MSFKQLNDLEPEELKQHARQIVSEACHAVARAQARVAVAAAAVGATPMDEDIKAAFLAAKETEVAARAAMARAVWAERSAVLARARAEEARARAAAWTRAARAATAEATAEAIANLDILHRQQMMGDWSDDINEAYIQDRIYETRPDVIKAKKETKEHMGSMLGDWDKAGKLLKRHTSKNRKKTKRKRQKIAKRIKGTKRRK